LSQASRIDGLGAVAGVLARFGNLPLEQIAATRSSKLGRIEGPGNIGRGLRHARRKTQSRQDAAEQEALPAARVRSSRRRYEAGTNRISGHRRRQSSVEFVADPDRGEFGVLVRAVRAVSVLEVRVIEGKVNGVAARTRLM